MNTRRNTSQPGKTERHGTHHSPLIHACQHVNSFFHPLSSHPRSDALMQIPSIVHTLPCDPHKLILP